MKTATLVLMTTTLLGFSVACSSGRTGHRAGPETTGAKSPDWKMRKSAFISESSARIRDISSDLTEMDQRTAEGDEWRKDRAVEAVHDAQDELASVRAQLRELEKAKPADWQDEREEFLSSMNELEEKFDRARSFHY